MIETIAIASAAALISGSTLGAGMWTSSPAGGSVVSSTWSLIRRRGRAATKVSANISSPITATIMAVRMLRRARRRSMASAV